MTERELQVTALISGPIVALLPIMVWEVGLRPWIKRQNVAYLILCEIRANAQNLLALRSIKQEKIKQLPRHIMLDVQAFAAVAESMSELSSETLGRVIHLYNMFGRFNAIAQDCDAAFERYLATPTGSNEQQEKLTYWQTLVALALSQLDDTMPNLQKVLPLLARDATPWWSRRKRAILALSITTLPE